MNTRIVTVCFAVAGLTIAPGCFEHDAGEVTSVDRGTDPARGNLTVSVQPDSGKIGATINLNCARFHPSWRYSIFFPGVHDALSVDCEMAGTLSAVVPFGARSGPVSVPIDRHTAVSSTFRVTEQSDTLSVTVTPYDITPGITPKDSSIIDWQGRHCAWNAELHEDTVHVWRRYSTGDEVYENHVKLLHARGGHLPSVIAVWGVAISDYPGTRADTIRAGILKIQNWDTNAVMSGRFFGKPWRPYYLSNGTMSFWVDRRLSLNMDAAKPAAVPRP